MIFRAVSFSQSEDSLQLRGLNLMNDLLKFDQLVSLRNFEIPLCDSNKPDGRVPKGIRDFDQFLEEADALVFSISEAGGHYSAAFKNVIDWLIVKHRFNAKLGRGYSLTSKPIYVLTFTPTHKNSGDRHFEMTKYLLTEKFGANVRRCTVFHKCWENVLPGQTSFVAQECLNIKNDLDALAKKSGLGRDLSTNAEDAFDVDAWIKNYEKWNQKWMES